jgi:hypothetical protein
MRPCASRKLVSSGVLYKTGVNFESGDFYLLPKCRPDYVEFCLENLLVTFSFISLSVISDSQIPFFSNIGGFPRLELQWKSVIEEILYAFLSVSELYLRMVSMARGVRHSYRLPAKLWDDGECCFNAPIISDSAIIHCMVI